MPRTFSKDTNMWRSYEELFLAPTEPDNYNAETGLFVPVPIVIACESKGQALNLAMGLNACQIQDFLEKGTPKSFITKSAKAKESSPGSNQWILEVSVSYRHRTKPQKVGSIFDKILTQSSNLKSLDPDEPNISPLEKIRRLGMQSQASHSPDNAYAPEAGSIVPPRVPHDDDYFSQMFSVPPIKPQEKE